MSKINGEKARFAAARKKKLRRRIAMRALRRRGKTTGTGGS
jgi:hypothetical protein